MIKKLKELWEIFSVFFKIGILTFGGGYTMLPLLQKDVVRRLRWVTDEDIIDYYAISQSLPGIIAGNTAMLIGYKKGGLPGLAAALLGVSFPSVIVILTIALFITNFLHLEAVGHAFKGIRVAVAVLIVNSAASMWKSGVKDKACAVIFLAAFLAFTMSKISPAVPVVLGAAAGVALKKTGKGKKAA
jgi:chromate transporter